MALREMSGHLEKERASLRTRKNQNPKGLILVDAQVDWGEKILLTMGGHETPRAWAIMSIRRAAEMDIPGKKWQAPFVRSTRRAVPAKGACHLFPKAVNLFLPLA